MKYQDKIHSILVAIAEGGDYLALCRDIGLHRHIELFDEIDKLYKTGLFLDEELPLLAARQIAELNTLNSTISLLNAPVSAVTSLSSRLRH